MIKFRESIVRAIQGVWRRAKGVQPLPAGWRGASISLAVVTLFIFALQCYYMLASRSFISFIIGAAVSLVTVALATGAIAALLHYLKRIPSRYVWVLLTALVLLYVSFILPTEVAAVLMLATILIASLLGALVWGFLKGSFKQARPVKRAALSALLVMTVAAAGIGGYWLLQEGVAALPETHTLRQIKTADRYASNLRNPAEEGPFQVRTLSYGSENSYRKEFNLLTPTFDGSALVKGWSPGRTKHYGFGADRMPLNGLVWYPEGEGPFPLVIAAHGNHLAYDDSDPGYAYLGRLLASRGYIFVSIDANFLNVAPYEDRFLLQVLMDENPARAVLMLEHVKVWEEWNRQAGNSFRGKVDMNQIALVGHSRGGEAAMLAAALNQLSLYPDDGNMALDYGFAIRSVIAIAGTDQQYKPSGKPLPLKDVNYLSLHGAHDMDVISFDGASAYDRVTFTQQGDYFKTYVYVPRANHGQFNSTWGREDGAGMANRLFNTGQLMPREEQEQIAEVLISAFLEATLKGRREYRAVFQDIGYAREWLPDHPYVTNYADSRTILISSYDEDIDLTSTTIPGGQLSGLNLREWKEAKVKLKFAEQHFSAVRLGWDSKDAAYTVVLPTEGLQPTSNSMVVFSMADGDEGNRAPTDLTVRVEDMNGNQASLPLSHLSPLLPMVEGKILKPPFASFSPTAEPVFQHFGFPLADFRKANPSFDPAQLAKVSFVFDRTEQGTVLMTDIGLRD